MEMENDTEPIFLPIAEYNTAHVECVHCNKMHKNLGYGITTGEKCSSFISKTNGNLYCGYGSNYDYYTEQSLIYLRNRKDVLEINNKEDAICDQCINELIRLGKLVSYDISPSCVCCNRPFANMEEFMYRYVIDLGGEIHNSGRYLTHIQKTIRIYCRTFMKEYINSFGDIISSSNIDDDFIINSDGVLVNKTDGNGYYYVTYKFKSDNDELNCYNECVELKCNDKVDELKYQDEGDELKCDDEKDELKCDDKENKYFYVSYKIKYYYTVGNKKMQEIAYKKVKEYKKLQSKLKCHDTYLWICKSCSNYGSANSNNLYRSLFVELLVFCNVGVVDILDIILSYHDRQCFCLDYNSDCN